MRGQDETNTSSRYERVQSVDVCLCSHACMYVSVLIVSSMPKAQFNEYALRLL